MGSPGEKETVSVCSQDSALHLFEFGLLQENTKNVLYNLQVISFNRHIIYKGRPFSVTGSYSGHFVTLDQKIELF